MVTTVVSITLLTTNVHLEIFRNEQNESTNIAKGLNKVEYAIFYQHVFQHSRHMLPYFRKNFD